MIRSIFYKFFATPQFLQMPITGIDISDTTMRFIEIVEKRKGMEIGKFGEKDIPRGIVESGEIKKQEELTALLRDLKNKYHIEFVAVSLPEEQVYLFDLELPFMKHEEIRGAIELLLEEQVPLKVSEALFDYEIEKETEHMLLVSVSVAPRILVEGYLKVFSDAGITPLIFEIESQSIARAVVPEGDKEPFLVVDFGKTRSGLAIVHHGRVEFTSTIPVGGASITEAIAKNLKISYSEAETIKRENGIVGISGNEDLSLALISTVSILRDEVAKHISYWRTHGGHSEGQQLDIKKIYLCGGEANLHGLIDYLYSETSTPIVLANALVNVNTLDEYVPDIDFSNSLRYATAIGLALRRPQ